jgi:RNA polymerase sigma-70 factor (ECF subfamily)
MEEQFLQAYEEYADAIFRHCAMRISDRERGKELMQETFLKAWESVRRGTKVENMRAFLYKVANNLIIDTYRRDRGEVSLEDMAEEKGFDPADEHLTADVERVHAGNEVLEKLHELEEPYRTALVMRYVDGLEPKDIADMLGISANVASVRIHRGLKHLSQILGHTSHA